MVSWDGPSSLPALGFQEAWHPWVNFCTGFWALRAPGVTCHLLWSLFPCWGTVSPRVGWGAFLTRAFRALPEGDAQQLYMSLRRARACRLQVGRLLGSSPGGGRDVDMPAAFSGLG